MTKNWCWKARLAFFHENWIVEQVGDIQFVSTAESNFAIHWTFSVN